MTFTGFGHVVELRSWRYIQVPIHARPIVFVTPEQAWKNAAIGLPSSYVSKYSGKAFRARVYPCGIVLGMDEDPPTYQTKPVTRAVFVVDGIEKEVLLEGHEPEYRLGEYAYGILRGLSPYADTLSIHLTETTLL